MSYQIPGKRRNINHGVFFHFSQTEEENDGDSMI